MPGSETPEIISDKEVEARIGKSVKRLQMVLLGDRLYHPCEGGWEPFPDCSTIPQDQPPSV